eukprot:7705616-Ditylum_brightwellii.AAC.1
MRVAVGGNHGSSCLRFHGHWAFTSLGEPAWEINSLGDYSNVIPYMSLQHLLRKDSQPGGERFSLTQLALCPG